MSNCTCSRTTRPPLCDASHCLTEAQYKERTERLAALFKKPPPEQGGMINFIKVSAVIDWDLY